MQLLMSNGRNGEGGVVINFPFVYYHLVDVLWKIVSVKIAIDWHFSGSFSNDHLTLLL